MAALLNLFDVVAHFSPRLHEKFVSELMTRRNYCVISEHFAHHLKELRGPPVAHGPPVEKRCSMGIAIPG